MILAFLLLNVFLLSIFQLYGFDTARFAMLFFVAFSGFIFVHDFILPKYVPGAILFPLSVFAGSFLVQGSWHTFLALAMVFLFACFYYVLRLFLQERVLVSFVVLSLVLFLSLFDSKTTVIMSLIVSLVAFIVLLCKRRYLKRLILSDCKYLASLSSMDLFAWTMFFMGIVCFGVQKGYQFFMVDPGHTFYEASIGFSYYKSLFNAPDFAYAGKIVKFHFLSTQLPFYFSHIFNVSYLASAMFFARLFLGGIFFSVVNSVLSKFESKIPIFVLLNLPFFWGIGLYPDSLVARCGLGQLSFFLGFVFSIFSLYFFIEKKYKWFFAAVAFLALSKISFFVVLVGGITLFFLRTWNMKKLVLFVSPLCVLFLLVNHLFLNGAHAHNLWIIYPSFLTTVFVSWWWAWVLMLFAGAVYVYFTCSANRVLLFLSSYSLSGLLGFCFISEVSEGNSLQFYVATYFALAIVFWPVFKQLLLLVPNRLRQVLWGIVLLLILVSAVRQYNRVHENVRRVLFKYYRKDLDEKIGDVVEAYSWLAREVSLDRVVLFGKHYERFDNNVFEPTTGFVRSVMSRKQLYCEEYRGKGILMMEDFSSRFANTLHFYKHFVQTTTSKEALSPFYALKLSKGMALPLSKSNKLWYMLSLGKEWWLCNRVSLIKEELVDDLMRLPKSEAWARNFLKSNKIGYVVLENGDKPTGFLQTLTEEIYQNKSVTILSVKRDRI